MPRRLGWPQSCADESHTCVGCTRNERSCAVGATEYRVVVAALEAEREEVPVVCVRSHIGIAGSHHSSGPRASHRAQGSGAGPRQRCRLKAVVQAQGSCAGSRQWCRPKAAAGPRQRCRPKAGPRQRCRPKAGPRQAQGRPKAEDAQQRSGAAERRTTAHPAHRSSKPWPTQQQRRQLLITKMWALRCLIIILSI